MRKIVLILYILLAATAAHAAQPASARAALGKPDLEAIRAASIDEHSQFYYPTLMRAFLRNDTSMTSTEYQYLYYGTLFQEDFDPYRQPAHPEQLEALAPLFAKDNLTRAERQRILDYAIEAVDDDPMNLRQINNRIYGYEQKGNTNLARIWQNKLNHLLLVIAASGTGADKENAWIVVSPQHEYDVLNFKGLKATGHNFEPPYYDYIEVEHSDKQPAGYYFNIEELLKQYFLKHPSELEGAE
ncbi:MAG: DUF4919 domain-containing protein [Muribaculaceae bacterium]|nr:DUF4919 domain-containing protein [Muribaculaceae bacterium]